jgi:hypothetical protein
MEDRDASICRVEDGGSTVLRNVGIYPPHYMALTSKKTMNYMFTAVKISNVKLCMLFFQKNLLVALHKICISVSKHIYLKYYFINETDMKGSFIL